MSHFLRLSRELRDVIYEYCLVVEGILDPCPPYYEEKDPKNAKLKPNTDLLMVNRQVGTEAAQVLYGKNVWRLSCQQDDPSWPDSPYEAKSWENNIIMYMRHIVVKSDSRDADHEVVAAISYAQSSGQPDPDFDSAVTNIAEFIQERLESEIYRPWL